MPNELYKELIKRISLIVDGHLTLPNEYFEEGAYSYGARMARLKSRNKPGKPDWPDIEGMLIEGSNLFIFDLLSNVINHPDKLEELIKNLDKLIYDDNDDYNTNMPDVLDANQYDKNHNEYNETNTSVYQNIRDIKDGLSKTIAERWPKSPNGRPKIYISVVELAKILDESKDTIYTSLKKKKLPCITFGDDDGKTKFTIDHVVTIAGLDKYL